MNQPLIWGFLWLLAANLAAMLPSRRGHWPAAIALIVTGLPLLVWVISVHGIWVGLFLLIAGASLLRWPLIFAARRLRRLLTGPRDPSE